MIRILLLLGFIFYSFPSLAKIVFAKGTYTHDEKTSTSEGCKYAYRDAELQALKKVTKITLSSVELETCSQVDGKSDCEYNLSFIKQLGGELTNVEIKDKKKYDETLNNGEVIYHCDIHIKANAEEIKWFDDPKFDFNVKLNEFNYRVGDNLTMEINVTKPMYLTIFQYQPYIEKDYQIYKLFPNEREENNYIKGTKLTLPFNAKYEIYFPEKVKEKNVVEYLIYIVSDEDINWLNEYNNIYELKSQIISSIKRVKYKHKQYTIYK